MSEQQNPGSQATDTQARERRLRVAEGDPFATNAETTQRLLNNLETVIRGKRHELTLVLCALACKGHVLFEDVPGTAKTVLSRSIAQSIEGAIPSRIQCTPDLQPTDVTGLSVYNQQTRDFEFRPGPIFANIVLLDEINRATPKTQSALLEAMAEGQVTVDGVTRELPDPFLLLATENPIEHEGTFLLPEAELDRFFLRTALGYPNEDDEFRIILDQRHGHPLEDLEPVLTEAAVRDLQRAVEQVFVHPMIQHWLVDLVRSTRELDIVELGASVRGTLALERAVRAYALVNGRAWVEPGDVEALFVPVIAHRVLFSTAFIGRTRSLDRAEVLQVFSRRCFEMAPQPGL